jgi:hypothetical protein
MRGFENKPKLNIKGSLVEKLKRQKITTGI